ncbi:MAG: hypothetical protein HYX92_10930 [Chloroflexi bacterium]|nr:hypothetical protein [Chloroflexota bacterium]
MSGILAPILVPTGLLIVAALIIYLVSRLRVGGLQEISVRSLLVFYFYLVTVVSLIVTLVGVSVLVKAGLGAVLGPTFSYYRPPLVKPAVPPPALNGRPVPPMPPQPMEEEQRMRQQREIENNLRSDLLQGGTAAFIGGLVWLAHVYGRRRIETDEERRESMLNRAYLFLVLAVSSIVGIISAAQGIYETLRFYLIQPLDQYAYQAPPGGMLATAIVFVPVWAYYLSTLAREWRRRAANG